MNEMVVALLVYLTQELGSQGSAIVVLSLGIRIALLPLTLTIAKRARRQQEMMQRLQPEIEQLRKRFDKKPERLFEEIRNLYRKHNCRPFDVHVLLGNLVQLPIFALLYGSIRASLNANSAFLWIRNLAKPDFLLVLVILALTGVCAGLMPAPSQHGRSMLIMAQVLVTFLIVWKLAA